MESNIKQIRKREADSSPFKMGVRKCKKQGKHKPKEKQNTGWSAQRGR